MSWSKRALFLSLLFGLAACGFRPMYGSSSVDPKVGEELAQISVRPINNRMGQMVHNALLTNLNPKGEPLKPVWTLSVNITTAETQEVMQKDSTSTRNSLTYTAQYTLFQAEKNIRVDTGTVTKIMSYDFIDQHYSDVTAAADIERRAATAIASEVRDRLAIYFARRAKALSSRPAS